MCLPTILPPHLTESLHCSRDRISFYKTINLFSVVELHEFLAAEVGFLLWRTPAERGKTTLLLFFDINCETDKKYIRQFRSKNDDVHQIDIIKMITKCVSKRPWKRMSWEHGNHLLLLPSTIMASEVW